MNLSKDSWMSPEAATAVRDALGVIASASSFLANPESRSDGQIQTFQLCKAMDAVVDRVHGNRPPNIPLTIHATRLVVAGQLREILKVLEGEESV